MEASRNEPSEEVLKRTANILNITTDYIVLAESAHKGVRLLEPHGARYLGSLITFSLELDKDNTIRVGYWWRCFSFLDLIQLFEYFQNVEALYNFHSLMV